MKPDFTKLNGLLPAVIQHAENLQVLMVGYMNEQALRLTIAHNQVYFYSRSRHRIWKKGETSGNTLGVISIAEDCDQDTLLIKVLPAGPTCHTGAYSCFGEREKMNFLNDLEKIISKRIDSGSADSYVSQLVQKGINKVAQKVGEEAVEVVIEATDNNDDLFKNEAADLLFHLMILLKIKGTCLRDIEEVLRQRHVSAG